MPKVFRLTNKAKLTEGIFRGDTMNTPSMLCVEDALDGLRWAERIGGLPALFARSEANLRAIADFVEEAEGLTSWHGIRRRDQTPRSA